MDSVYCSNASDVTHDPSFIINNNDELNLLFGAESKQKHGAHICKVQIYGKAGADTGCIEILTSVSQYVVVAYDGKCNIYNVDTYCNTKGMYRCVSPFPLQNITAYSKVISYIWNISSREHAEIFNKIYPRSGGMDISVQRSHDLIGVYSWRGSSIRVLNTGTIDRYLNENGKTYHLPPQGTCYISSSKGLNAIAIRSTPVPSNAKFNELSIDEQEMYIPKHVISGLLQINASHAFEEWVPVTDYLYYGSLTYESTSDKDFHMVDENGKFYRYGAAMFRTFIPHLCNGVVTGVFKYAPTGARSIRYVLVPHVVGGSNLVLCDSSDSESELS